MEDTVRWSLKVSRETDEALRAHLGRTGARKGDLSKFVQEAVQARLLGSGAPRRQARARKALGEALREVRSRTRGMSQARLEKLVAEAVAYARARR
jgi:hypothetical protein